MDYIKNLSKSKVNSFKDCPHKYYLSKNNPQAFVTSPAMVRGSELHQLFEDVYKGLKFEIDEKYMIDKFKELDKDNKYEKEIKMFINWNKSRNFMVPEFLEKKTRNQELDTTFIIDRVDFDGNNRVLLDYKSGRRKPVKEFKEELMFYVINFEMVERKKVHYVSIYFIDHGVDELIEITDNDRIEALANFLEVKDQIRDYQNQGVFPFRKTWKCRFCGYKDICEAMKEDKKW